MKAKLVVSVVGLAIGACVGSSALAKDSASQKFLAKAIQGNLAEVAMGQLAEQQGSSSDVKAFGQTLQKDHSDANTKAMAAASALGMDAPSEPTKKQISEHDQLAKLSGDRFDREFARHMAMDHKKDIAEYSRAAKMKSGDQAVTYAAETLPVLQSHLKTAEGLTKGGKAQM
jgi:putative membrane protein